MVKSANSMTEEELRQELQKIRAERSGVGRRRVKQAKSKRIEGVNKERRRKDEAQKEESAEWV
ncbi:hypothetical protein LCGC14_0788690 [marine sediment metagenome]|uniref:Uncharacterized protein n=1 Tax=marine sediment metagenome TaxID=412755 RepID=A0A0F9T0B5_9ZZZZ